MAISGNEMKASTTRKWLGVVWGMRERVEQNEGEKGAFAF